jgi:lactate dehydrogenase-like 2-hydroxyacid dehydrogenase
MSGKAVEKIGRALGMQVLIAERKGAAEVRPGRTLFEEALKRGTLFIIVVPLDETTRNMFGKKEFDVMQPTALVVNVGRGGVTSEQDLIDALKSGKLAGAATDVFEIEPATKENCRLLDRTVPNLLLSPHVAWYVSQTEEVPPNYADSPLVRLNSSSLVCTLCMLANLNQGIPLRQLKARWLRSRATLRASQMASHRISLFLVRVQHET